MDGWQAAQNWAIFGAALAGLAWYYYPTNKRPQRSRELEKPRLRDQFPSPVPAKRLESNKGRKRKADAQGTSHTPVFPAAASTAEADDNDVDDSTREFAKKMLQARKGTDLKKPESNESRVKTVKQGSALNDPAAASRSAVGVAEAGADSTPAASPPTASYDFSDMLEPAAPGPAALRITAPQTQAREKGVQKPKNEAVETKKQRQNRLKNEERKQQHLEQEQERRSLEEKQRRAAREARGEPARNGIPASKPPANSAWTAPKAASPVETGSNLNGPMLDTFDAESTSSSNAGNSTSPTSTNEGGPMTRLDDLPSEEEQFAMLLAQDEGWNEVKTSKKPKKKGAGGEANGTSTPVRAPLAESKVGVNGKPTGFQALGDEFEQRTDADPSDASNWDA